MKKLLASLVISGAVLLSGVSVFAASPAKSGVNYVDANGDGICDNLTINKVRPQDGTGLKAGNKGGGQGGSGQGSNYIDADGDGICDNFGTVTVRPQDGTGAQAGNKGGGQGNNYVDADGDGVCDNYPAGSNRPGNGSGSGGRGCRRR